MIDYPDFTQRVHALENRIGEACAKVGRQPASVTLLPVTKTHPAQAAIFAANYGFAAVGENRVQELEEKRGSCGEIALQWELIGHLQSNKARRAAELADRVQSVDSEKLARKLNAAATDLGRKLPVLLQVNAGEDPAKFGLNCDAVDALVEAVLGMEYLRLDGLMTIAPLDEDREVARRCFLRLRETRDRLVERFACSLPELSMGMSGDLEEAIEAGSTIVRVGSALFGQR